MSPAFLVASLLGIYWIRSRKDAKKVRTIRVGTRKSDLAMVQTRKIVSILKAKFPDLVVQIIDPVEAIGDRNISEHLKKMSQLTPGLFTSGLEAGLVVKKYDCVVHSLKDMPTRLPKGLCLAAITERKDPRDALIIRPDLLSQMKDSKSPIEGLPEGSVIGTSSIRREAILRHQLSHKNFKYELIRGNVNLRLTKLDSGKYDATILAVAGLDRLGTLFQERITQHLDPPEYLYGVSQGSLGIECRSDDTELIEILKSACAHAPSTYRCLAERSVLRTLEGGCQLPLGVASEFDEPTSTLKLHAKILDEKGEKYVEDKISGVIECDQDATALGASLATIILEDGGKEILNSLTNYGSDDERNIKRPLTYGSAANPHVEARPSAK